MKKRINGLLALLLVLITQITFAQDMNISGVVSDSNGVPIPGANVKVKSTSVGTSTDFDGSYKVKAKSTDVLVYSFQGMNTVELKVSGVKMNCRLSSKSTELEGVIVVGYGVQKKKDLTSSISKISGSDIQGLVAPSFESLLSGRAPGIQVTSPTGIVGQAPVIRIRGVASITSGTTPLYVVDGMPMFSGDIVNGDAGGYANANPLGDINPADIESIDVLKDGAATAIYGSRAANGVILITTKKGKIGDTKVSYNSVVGFSSPIKRFDLLNTEQFLIIANEKRTNALPVLTPWAAGNLFDTDWQAAVLRKSALQIDHNLSISGGSEKTKYYFSLGYTSQEGVAKANELTRYSLRSNLEHKVNKWFTLGGNVGLTKTDFDGISTGRNAISGNIFSAIRQLPNTPIYDSSNPTGYNLNLVSGNVGQGTNLAAVGNNLSNIVYVLDNNKLQSKVQRTLINVFASADISKSLNYRIQMSSDNIITNGFRYLNPVNGDGRPTGNLSNSVTNFQRWNIQNILTYNKTFLEVHNVSATGVIEHQKEKNQFSEGVGTDISDTFYNQNLVTGAYTTQQANGSVSENGIVSYVTRFGYNFKQRYYIQGSLRRDGLSKLPTDSKWNIYPGYSAGWNIAKESFMSGINKYVSEFKLRASYSEVGNTDIANYPYFNLTSASQYGTANGIGYTQFGNNLLQWESSKKYDYGVDLSVLNNKVKITFDYYKNDIDQLILDVPTAPSLGIPSNRIAKNTGKIQNTGLEFGLEFNIINNSNFKWNVNTNLTLQKSIVTELPSNNADLVGGSSTDININPNIIIRVDESPNSLFGYEYWGVNSSNGNPVYVKSDGSLVQGNIAGENYKKFDPANPTDISVASSLALTDRKILGNTLPTYFGGVNSSMSFKNFDFGFLIKFSGGNKIFNSTRRELLNQELNNNGSEILGRWQSISLPGDGVTPRLWAGKGNFINLAGQATTRFVENGDFINLENISLGYSMPKSLTEKIKVDKIRFFLQLQNAFIITKYKGINPEMETLGVDLNGTPRAKIFSMGININL